MIHPKRAQTTAAVAAHYDWLDLFYREVWGEHVHHGLWAAGRESALAAAEALVHIIATRLDLAPGQALCDIGCGYGATAVRLAERARRAVRSRVEAISSALDRLAASGVCAGMGPLQDRRRVAAVSRCWRWSGPQPLPEVTGILDRLRVRPAQRMGDGELRDLVRDAVLQEPALRLRDPQAAGWAGRDSA
jgi:hypothetical protein